MHSTPNRVPGRTIRLWLTLFLLNVFSLGAMASDAATADTSSAVGATAATTPSASADQPKQCYSGCQSWGQMCNVDPRGVYKCQRHCEKFGEICE